MPYQRFGETVELGALKGTPSLPGPVLQERDPNFREIFVSEEGGEDIHQFLERGELGKRFIFKRAWLMS